MGVSGFVSIPFRLGLVLVLSLFRLHRDSLNCSDLDSTLVVLTEGVFVSYCLFSRSMDVFSTSSLALTAFTVDASKSSAPLQHTHINIM